MIDESLSIIEMERHEALWKTRNRPYVGKGTEERTFVPKFKE